VHDLKLCIGISYHDMVLTMNKTEATKLNQEDAVIQNDADSIIGSRSQTDSVKHESRLNKSETSSNTLSILLRN